MDALQCFWMLLLLTRRLPPSVFMIGYAYLLQLLCGMNNAMPLPVTHSSRVILENKVPGHKMYDYEVSLSCHPGKGDTRILSG